MEALPVITCAWCGKVFNELREDCARCGGALPPPDGADAGAPPPPVPRVLPTDFRRRVLVTRNETVLAAGLLLIFATASAWGFLPFSPRVRQSGFGIQEGYFLALFGVFFLFGAALLWFGLRRGMRAVRIVEFGEAAGGTIIAVTRDAFKSLGGRPHTVISYIFAADGEVHNGEAHTCDDAVAREAGQPVHVLYQASNPRANVIYPPVSRFTAF